MKFAKELSDDLVPEWRVKYLDYKLGKKKIKDISRALAKINQTPRTPKLLKLGGSNVRTPFNLFNQAQTQPVDSPVESTPDPEENFTEPNWNVSGQASTGQPSARHGTDGAQSQAVRALTSVSNRQRVATSPRIGERSPLRTNQESQQNAGGDGTYGSMSATPSLQNAPIGPPALELPDPALSIGDPLLRSRFSLERQGVQRASSVTGDAYAVGRTHAPSKTANGRQSTHRNLFLPRRTFSTPDVGISDRPTLFKKLFASRHSQPYNSPDVPLQAYHEFDLKQADFFKFLDKELGKVETFYKMKEHEAAKRLDILHDQLRIMRDRRVHELLEDQRKDSKDNGKAATNGHGKKDGTHSSAIHDVGAKWIRPIENVLRVGDHVGKNSKALQDMVAAKQHAGARARGEAEGWRDFSRRKPQDDVSYRNAKRKLKMALQEYYRGLELLKSYALLNQTAFRKISKKYDKAVMARPTYRYMSDNVNKAWFVQSERLQRLIVECEDLYSRYFERSNHKAAVNKLRSSTRKHYYSGSVFRNGILLAAGSVLGIQGTAYAAGLENTRDGVIASYTNYLLQLYGGYFLTLVLFLFFVLDCRQWTRSKINYVFIFEFDNRHNLDWRQLAELPCLFSFLLGLTMWLNFHEASPSAMFLYWPVILIGLTLAIMFFPRKTLYWRSRAWMLYSLWRLFFAGIYAVEFRDFFLGDMFCSLTYMMQNIEVFFCLYAQQWSDPETCNSSHSRLLGFFSTLPGIWRALQCLRRYRDTHSAFPHLVNCGKYLCTILFYMSLSLYRIAEYTPYKAAFISLGVLNSIYVSVWDLVMDWSLCNPYAPHPYLRETLGYKTPAFYYTAMVIDPILRFNWLLYVILPVELQHSALLSFFISLSEVCRRGMWTLIRVENEHCTNVGRFRASRDVPLPYDVEDRKTQESRALGVDATIEPATNTATTTSLSTKPATTTTSESVPSGRLKAADTPSSRFSPNLLRRRRTVGPGGLEDGSDTPRKLNRVATMLATAHAQDFERRKRPSGAFVGLDGTVDSSDTKNEDEDASSDDGEEEDPGAESARLLGEREDDIRKTQAKGTAAAERDQRPETTEDREEREEEREAEELANIVQRRPSAVGSARE